MSDAPAPTRTVAVDCRYFLGDRPCVWHKREGAVCTCDHYAVPSTRVLIIKLDAMGDVLRTTTLLPLLATRYPNAFVTWITRPESVPLMQNNPYIHEVIAYGVDSAVHLSAREFDYAINLDAGKISAAIMASARAARKDGFVLHPAGYVTPTNTAAAAWLEMGTNDVLKRQGTRAYQDWMKAILGLSDVPGERYVLELTADERRAGREHLTQLGADLDRPIIGLNTGAGGRWVLKQWREEGFVELITRLGPRLGVQFLLLGGPAEEPRNRRLKQAGGSHVIDPGGQNPVRHFSALVACSDVVVTGDTLAMHISLALERRTIVLFGPTSAPEIELYGLGEKVLPDMTCLGCYKNTCDFVPNCMDLISVEMVEAAITRQLAVARR